MSVPNVNELSFKRATEIQDPNDLFKALLASSPSVLAANSKSSSMKTTGDNMPPGMDLQPSSDPITEKVKEMLTFGMMKQGFDALIEGGMHVKDLAPMMDEGIAAIQNIGTGIMNTSRSPSATSGVSPQVSQAGTTQQPWKAKGNFFSTPTQVNPNTGEVTPASILGGLISQSPSVTGQVLENQIRGQRIAGLEPMQKGKKEELDIQEAGKIAVKQLELDAKKLEEGFLKPEHILNKYEPVANLFQIVHDSSRNAEIAAKMESGAGDISLIYNFMKVQDPGSRVTDSEVSIAENIGSLPERFKGVVSKLLSEKGSTLSSKTRNDMVSAIKNMYEGKKRDFEYSREQFVDIAKRNKLDPDKILRKVGLSSGSYASLEEAIRAGHKAGDRVTINGVSGTLQ